MAGSDNVGSEPNSPGAGASFGAMLRAWRGRALLTQEELAEQTGLSVRTIRRLESDDALRPQSASIRLLAGALKLSTAERTALAAAGRGQIANADHDQPDHPPRSGGRSPHPAVEVPRQLPAPAPAFTGRVAELADLDRITDTTAVVITAIDGMAGIGKTALAVHAAHRVAGSYPDGQIFLDLHGYTEGTRPVEPGGALDRVLRALGVPGEQIPRDLDERAALYRSRLAGRKILIVLDNAAGEEQVRPLLPGTPGCLVLVTSRRRLAGLDNSHTVSLDVLPLSDAVTLFVRTAGEGRARGAPAELLAEVVELCGRLPLAIRIAAARLRSRPSWTVANLVERLRDHQHRLSVFEAGQRSVSAALDLSYQQLDAELQRAYRLCGLHPGADFDGYAVAALVDTTLAEAVGQVDRLLDAHLLHEPVPDRYRFHDLVRAHAAATAGREESATDRRAALGRLFDQYRHTASAAMDAAYPYERERRPGVPPSDAPTVDVSDPALATAWLDAELANLLAMAQHAADHGWPEHTLQVAAVVSFHLRTRARYADAEALLKLAVDAGAAGDRSAALNALIGLGQVHRLQARHGDAIGRYQQALTLAREIGDRLGELDALAGLGDSHRSRGEYEQAAGYFGMAREVARLTGRHGSELEVLLGLGWIHLAEGQPATDDFEQALETSRATGHRIIELHALRGLGHAHRIEGRYEEAISCFERALAIARVVGSHYGELGAMVGLGWVQRLQRRHEQAVDSYQHVLRRAREIGSGNFEFEALQGLGRLNSDGGAPELALTYHEQALDIATDLGQAGDQARACDGLAHAYRVMDQRELARQHWRRALDILTGLGTAHTDDDEATAETIRAHLDDLDQ